jgi:hypothetical protein
MLFMIYDGKGNLYSEAESESMWIFEDNRLKKSSEMRLTTFKLYSLNP